MDKIFETWKEKGVKFIAIRCGPAAVHVMDENGNNYGSYFDIDNFKRFKRDNPDRVLLGKAELTMRVLIQN